MRGRPMVRHIYGVGNAGLIMFQLVSLLVLQLNLNQHGIFLERHKPGFDTILKVVHALGIELHAAPIAN